MKSIRTKLAIECVKYLDDENKAYEMMQSQINKIDISLYLNQKEDTITNTFNLL